MAGSSDSGGARPSATGDTAPVAVRVLPFRAGGAWFALDAGCIDQVLEDAPLHPIPDGEPDLAGLLPRAGVWIPVVPANAVLNGNGAHDRDGGPVLVLRRGGVRVGLAVDEVGRIDDLCPDASPEVYRMNDRLVSLVDVASLFPSTEPDHTVDEILQDDSQLQLLSFRVGPQEFGLDVHAVGEVMRLAPVTPVPGVPDFVEGVIDVRDGLVPVIDLRRRFEVNERAVHQDTRVVLVPFDGEHLGLVVDDVSEVIHVPPSAVSDPPPYFRGLAAEYIRKIVRYNGRIIILIDMDRVLTSEERIALQEADLREGAP